MLYVNTTDDKVTLKRNNKSRITEYIAIADGPNDDGLDAIYAIATENTVYTRSCRYESEYKSIFVSNRKTTCSDAIELAKFMAEGALSDNSIMTECSKQDIKYMQYLEAELDEHTPWPMIDINMLIDKIIKATYESLCEDSLTRYDDLVEHDKQQLHNKVAKSLLDSNVATTADICPEMLLCKPCRYINVMVCVVNVVRNYVNNRC